MCCLALQFIMGMTLIGVMTFFKEGWRLWKPLTHIRSYGPICCVIIGLVVEAVGRWVSFLPTGCSASVVWGT